MVLAAVALGCSGRQRDAATEARANVEKRLASRALSSTTLLDDTRTLTGFGGRITGSPACEKATTWARSRFVELGLAAEIEEYDLPGLWLPASESAEIVARTSTPLRVAACPGSPPVELEAAVKDAGDGGDAALASLGDGARGAILLVRFAPRTDGPTLFARAEAARRTGAVALLVESTREGAVLERRPLGDGESVSFLPAAVVTKVDAARLRREAASGARVRLALRVGAAPNARAANVVATRPGTTRAGESVLLAAHLDSWDLGTGALDDGVNAALVLDVARAFHDLGLAPSRTIRFVLFTGEEQGMRGSFAYVERHAKELSGLVAAVVFDLGSGRTTGFFTGKRRELRPAVNEAARALPPPSILVSLDSPYAGTDTFPFLLAGVPALASNQDLSSYGRHRHAETDIYERVDEEEARRNVAVASTLVWALADGPLPLPARISTAEAAARLRRAGVTVPETLRARFSALFGR